MTCPTVGHWRIRDMRRMGWALYACTIPWDDTAVTRVALAFWFLLLLFVWSVYIVPMNSRDIVSHLHA